MINEEDHVEFDNYKQLSYKDSEKEDVQIYKDGKPIGNIKVFLDSEMEDREYICINYTIVYLDTLAKWKPTTERIKQFKKEWGQSNEEICSCLGYDEEDSEDMIMGDDYFWDDEDDLWLNKDASGFQDDDQEVADYLKNL